MDWDDRREFRDACHKSDIHKGGFRRYHIQECGIESSCVYSKSVGDILSLSHLSEVCRSPKREMAVHAVSVLRIGVCCVAC